MLDQIDREQLRVALRQLLAALPGQNKRQLLAGLRDMGLRGLTTRDVNRVLYANRATFVHDGATLPRWRLSAAALEGDPTFPYAAPPALPQSYIGDEPYAWQIEALAEWRANGRRGIVQAVTGTGKTTVGALAAAAAFDAGEKVLVLVPSRELLHQWHCKLQRTIHGATVGRFGDGHTDTLGEYSILVAIVHSAAAHDVLPPGVPGLIVADEVHRYGTPGFARALEPGFRARLGLTATYERHDDGLGNYLQPYFGEVVAGCSYERGLTEGILAPVRVAFVGVDFTPAERKEHDEYDKAARRYRNVLVSQHGAPAEPFGEFMAFVEQLSKGGDWDPDAVRYARGYMGAFSNRRMLMAGVRGKVEAMASLAPVIAAADRSLVFGESIDSAQRAAEVLRANGVEAMVYTSGPGKPGRMERLGAFKTGQVKVLTTARVLDEGIDVPEADVGVVMAGSKSKRQMIQRMGRLIRPKADGRPATFIVLYVKGTAEDPDRGAYEDFCEELTGVVDEIPRFDAVASGAQLLLWYLQPRFPHLALGAPT